MTVRKQSGPPERHTDNVHKAAPSRPCLTRAVRASARQTSVLDYGTDCIPNTLGLPRQHYAPCNTPVDAAVCLSLLDSVPLASPKNQVNEENRIMSRKVYRDSSRKKSRIKSLASARRPAGDRAERSGVLVLSPCRSRPTSPARSRTARGWSAVARSSPRPAPRSTSASGSARRPSR